jgi:hemerythrin
MLTIPLKPLLLLGDDAIDRDHQTFLEMVQAMTDSDNVAFPTLFRKLLEHTEEHFNRENELMVRCGVPTLPEHKSEHTRVLGEFHQFMARVDRGFIQFGRMFVIERLVPWFEVHVPSMDVALVLHLKAHAKYTQV